MSNRPDLLIEFEGLYNFRDIGGLETEDGAQSRKNVVYRSDAFGNLTEADAHVLLSDLNVERLIDLRADREVEAESPTLIHVDSVEIRRRPIDNGPGTAIESAPAGERLAFRYLEYLEYASSSIVGVIRDLAEPEQKVTIMHCRAGKDRTGVAVATVLSLIGVIPDEIVRDYALTSIGMPKIMARLRESPVYQNNVNRLPEEMYSSKEVTMRQFLKVVADRHGSLTEWSLAHGVSADELAALKANLTARAS
jgi:Protein tyrosine/serine phosphatase